jgi:hypothetical protein
VAISRRYNDLARARLQKWSPGRVVNRPSVKDAMNTLRSSFVGTVLLILPADAQEHRFEADPNVIVRENFVACDVLSQLQRVMDNPRSLLAGECEPLRAGDRIRVYVRRGPYVCIYPHDRISPCTGFVCSPGRAGLLLPRALITLPGPRNGEGSRRCGEIIPCSDLPQTSNNIIQKGLAFVREQSGTVTVPGTTRASGSLPRRL